MTIVLSDLSDATRAALDRADAVLVRASAALAAANLFADQAEQRLADANTRADRLQAKMT
jgi:hypothetical protein